MSKEDCKIHIIGAGIGGLIAAKVLEQHGFCPVIIEATDSVGGRVKTDIVNGYQLDHGFQVLLTAYPAINKHLNLKALELQNFSPGAVIFKKGKATIIGDPLRDFSLLLSTLFSGIGTFFDKIKILKLNKILKNKSVESIFTDSEQSTLSYLKDFGFSSKIIGDFFMPFFSGIFLENKLDTSSRMFEFIYKMFGEGYAALPKAGIEAIPKQLADYLVNTTFQFNREVKFVKDGEITLKDDSVIHSDFTIIATDASYLISNFKQGHTAWKSCDTLYFEVDKRNIEKPLIGLVPKSGSLINNIFYPTSLNTNKAGKNELLSVTVVDNQNLSSSKLVEAVISELKAYCNIENVTFIKSYNIPMALPKLENLQYSISPSKTRLTKQLFLAGDTQLNGSLNAAMLSGESSALGVIDVVSNLDRAR